MRMKFQKKKYKAGLVGITLTVGLLLGACANAGIVMENETPECIETEERLSYEKDILMASGEVSIDDAVGESCEEPKTYMHASRYEGYLDESPYEVWEEQFGNCDFDDDGRRDRIYREVTGTFVAYRIDFGNGDELELARTEDFFMDIKVQAADVCGYSGNEILFVGQHSFSTDPTAESDIYLYQDTFDGYERIFLPGQKEEGDSTTGVETILSDRGDECVTLECQAVGYEEIYAWDIWTGSEYTAKEFFERSDEPLVKTRAYDAAFIDYAGETKLVLYQNVTGKWLVKDVTFILDVSTWNDSTEGYACAIEKMEVGKVEGKTVEDILEEYSYMEIPAGKEYILAYVDIMKQYIEEYGPQKIRYNLIYFDEDENPELALGQDGYWISLYTCKDKIVHECMKEWPYGAGGNHGYEYIPYGNLIRNYDTDYAGLVLYESYYTLNSQYEMVDKYWLKQSYEDEEGYVLTEESDEDYDASNWHYYYEDREITGEEYNAYQIGGEYEYMHTYTSLSASEFIEALYAPLFF